MADMKASYMGIDLKNPFIVGACGFTANLDRIKQVEEAGAGAIVTASLFEEQIQYESYRLEEDLHQFDNFYAEMTEFFPMVRHGGPKEHLLRVRKIKQAVRIPVIASLNAVKRETWVEYARQLEDTGVDGLELNFYAAPSDFQATAEDIEKEQVATLREIKERVRIPVSVKLSPFYTNPLHFIKSLDQAGVNGFVLFNRFFQPDINVDKEANRYAHALSTEADHRVPLRYAGLLFGNINGDVCAGGGVLRARDAIKMILAGCACVQVVSALYKNKISYLGTLLKELEDWMQRKGYRDQAAFRGKMSAAQNTDQFFYRRAQYVKHLLKADYAD